MYKLVCEKVRHKLMPQRRREVLTTLKKIKRLLCSGVTNADWQHVHAETAIGGTVHGTDTSSESVGHFVRFCADDVSLPLCSSTGDETAAADESRHNLNEKIPHTEELELVNRYYYHQAPVSCSSLPSALKCQEIMKPKPPWTETIKPKMTGAQYKNFSQSTTTLLQGSIGQHTTLLSPTVWPIVQQCRSIKTIKIEEQSVVSVEEIVQALTKQDMKHDQGFTCFITKCPRLAQNNKKSSAGIDSNQMFINMRTGHFECQYCHKRGNWHDLQDNVLLISSLSQKRRKEFECFKDIDTVSKANRQSQQAVELYEGAMPIKMCASDVVEQIQENFDIHELQPSTLDKFGVRFNIKSNSLVLPSFDAAGKLMGVRRLTCTIPEENDNLRMVQDSLLPRSGMLGLFGFNTLTKDVTEAVLTCTEMDALAVYQETKAPVLALPAGFSALPQELLPSLERFTKLVLWFGGDIRAWEAAKLFAKKLNEKRCCILRPSIEDPGAFEALRRGLKLRPVLSKAKPVVHKSIVTFSQLRQEVFFELSNVEQVAGVKWKRYPALNRLLKGHRRGELTVFTGPTGSGKTTFISDYSLDLCMQGVNTLWGSFEINNVRLGKMMLTQFAQSNLSKNMGEFDKWANEFEHLPMYFMTFFGQESIRRVIEAMSHAVYIHDIAHVIVDNLQFMMGSDGDATNRFARQDVFISAFRKFATNMNCHVTLVIHPRKEKDSEDLTTASVFGSAKATQEADNVLILQDKRLSTVPGRKYLQVTKNRFDGDLGVVMLKFDKKSLSFAKPPKQQPKEETEEVEEKPEFEEKSDSDSDSE